MKSSTENSNEAEENLDLVGENLATSAAFTADADFARRYVGERSRARLLSGIRELHGAGIGAVIIPEPSALALLSVMELLAIDFRGWRRRKVRKTSGKRR